MVSITECDSAELEIVAAFQPPITVAYVIVGVIPCCAGIFYVVMLVCFAPHILIIVARNLMLSRERIGCSACSIIHPFEELPESGKLQTPILIVHVDVEVCFQFGPRRLVGKQLPVFLSDASVIIVVHIFHIASLCVFYESVGGGLL